MKISAFLDSDEEKTFKELAKVLLEDKKLEWVGAGSMIVFYDWGLNIFGVYLNRCEIKLNKKEMEEVKA